MFKDLFRYLFVNDLTQSNNTTVESAPAPEIEPEVNTSTPPRPMSLADYMGQEAAKVTLRHLMDVAQTTGDPLPHLLFTGGAGMGKTTLARIIANEMGVPFRDISATQISTWKEFLIELRQVTPHSILFLDEAHALKLAIQREMLVVTEDFKYSYVERGERYFEDLPPFTLMLATTHKGDLDQPLVRRFEEIQLHPYTEEELTEMSRATSRRICGVELPFATAQRIAHLSRRNADRNYKLTKAVANMALVTYGNNVTTAQMTGAELLERVLRMKGIDPLLGLDPVQRRYLVALLEQDGPVGISGIATLIGEQDDTVRTFVEPPLLMDAEMMIGAKHYQGPLVQLTPRGRVATEVGEAYLRACCRAQQNSDWFPNEKLVPQFVRLAH